MSALPIADLTATATFVLAAIALVLALATVALVLVTRAATVHARRAASAELDVLQRQLAAGYRPLLVDVLTTAPVPDDMDARLDVGQQPQGFDPRTVFVEVDAGKVFISVPLRNVGRGLAVIERSSVGINGPGLGEPEHRAVQRSHVPVHETTRIDIVAAHAVGGPIPTGTVWELRVPYADLAGGQRNVVSLQLVCRGDDAQDTWLVERVDQEPAGEWAPVLGEQTARDARTADDHAPRGDEAHATDSSAPTRGVRGEPVTDVWGNPVTKRKRRGGG
jgi:hypothetical protein